MEGAAEKNPKVRRGYSRDHRPDCEQLVIAPIVNHEGFPFSYETFDGNRSDVSTMETMLRMVGVDNAQPMTPMRAIALLSTLLSADIVLPTTAGREPRLRRITEPTIAQKSLLRQLGITMPEHLRFQRECSADSAVA